MSFAFANGRPRWSCIHLWRIILLWQDNFRYLVKSVGDWRRGPGAYVTASWAVTYPFLNGLALGTYGLGLESCLAIWARHENYCVYQIDNFSVQLMSNLVHYLSCQVVRGTTGAYLNFFSGCMLKGEEPWELVHKALAYVPTPNLCCILALTT